MELGGVSSAISKDRMLPLASLRLLVPPVQLVAASVWRVLKRQEVMNYWNVAEFVSLVMEMVPELLTHKHMMQLNLGLRARYILELCRSEESPDIILSNLEKIQPQKSAPVRVRTSDPTNPAVILRHMLHMEEVEEEDVTAHFLALIQILLKDPDQRREFFSEVFPAQYGPQYDADLQTLCWEFLCRLGKLLPVPDLEQTVLWLGDGASVLDTCVHSVSEPADLNILLQHHKHLGHLEQHDPPSSMGTRISSSLSTSPPCRIATPEPTNRLCLSATFVDETALEVVTEVELSASTCMEEVMAESCSEETGGGTEAQREIQEEESADTPEETVQEELDRKDPRGSVGPHDCPDCDKKFKFASSLTAHRVVHTGERPHRCQECGRCFSFRQSLDRHRNAHKTRAVYDCVVCKKTFHSLSARTQHKQTHKERGVYTCQQCKKKFSWELALARHIHTHAESENMSGGPEVVRADGTGCEQAARSIAPADGSGNEDHAATEPKDVTSLVGVRTSGRKRKPTLKIQLRHVQKQTDRPAPTPLSCGEHSYGSPLVSGTDGDDGCVATFSCPRCSFQHPDEVQVQQHMEKVHSVETEEKQRTPQALTHEETRFSCRDCQKRFRFQSLLDAHQRVHTGEQPFLCSQCGRRFSFKQSLERHKQTHESGRTYECLICGEFFKSLVDQREHKSSHMENGEFLCSECGRSFVWKSALIRHLKTHGEGPDEVKRWPRRGRGFSRASHLSRHLQTHRDEPGHTCNCGKSFAYRAALRAHQRIHQKERPHTCTQCGKGFLYKGGLLNHMKIHSEEMPFMCSYCGKCFKRERNMKKHERCHTRENVFSCSQCDKSFVYKATLIRHELTHSGERPYLCSDCGKSFFSHAELLKHERFHTGHKPFQCPHCGKKFTQSCYLTLHLRYHTGVRPYSCPQCDKSFLSANRLKRHQQTHTGEKPHLCVECGRGFSQSYHLKMHQRTHVMKLTD